MRISDWSSDVCSSDLHPLFPGGPIDNRAGNMLNVPVPAYTHGDELRRIVSDVWMPRLAEFRPEFIFISAGFDAHRDDDMRSEEHTSELQSLMRISYAVFCLKKKKSNQQEPV